MDFSQSPDPYKTLPTALFRSSMLRAIPSRLGQSDDVVLHLPSLHHQVFYLRFRCNVRALKRCGLWLYFYLLPGNDNGNHEWQGVVIDAKTLILDWDKRNIEKVLHLSKVDELHRCPNSRRT
ncbi:unnamed protein product [Haemonchus placei]|uniref:Uncharacterized protein n=1 Tax=Haemonchus placei TaxID=6290 RepID=A0A3P7VRJ3_HAEPC|nr:unnamed protein product [Haemonchus placei]